MSQIITKEELERRFTDEVNRRHGGGATLTRIQAKMAACRQLARDFRNGEFDREILLQFLIEQETALGSTPEAAKVYAEALLDGQEPPKIERFMGLAQVGNKQVG